MAATGHLEIYTGQVLAYDQHVAVLGRLFLSLNKRLLNVKVLGAVNLLLTLSMHLLIDFEHVIDRNLILHQGMEERSLSFESHADNQTGHVAFRYLYLTVLESSLQ